MSKPNPADLIAQVEKSPAAVSIHDKKAWMSIFAQYHTVEDPVGSTPHQSGLYDKVSGARGNAALSRFFDTYIAPNKISFDVKRDIVCGTHVVRDLSINIQMSEKVHATVPMHLLYELILENGEWKIVRLAAHWELIPMIIQLLGKGPACFGVLGALTIRMLKLQGIMGMLGFSKAAVNIGQSGKKAVKQFEQAFNAQKLSELMGVFVNDELSISFPYDETPIYPSQIFEKISGNLCFNKIMAAGDTVTSSFQFKMDEECKEGVAIFEFNRKLKKISKVRFYF